MASTISEKGQITIPKAFRDKLNLGRSKRVTVELEPTGEALQIRLAPDFLEVARKMKVRRKMDPVKAREYMEKNYERA